LSASGGFLSRPFPCFPTAIEIQSSCHGKEEGATETTRPQAPPGAVSHPTSGCKGARNPEVPPEIIEQFLAHDQAQRELAQFLAEYDLQSVVVAEFGPEALSQLKGAVGAALDERDLAKREDLRLIEETLVRLNEEVSQLRQRGTPPASAAPVLPIFSVPHPRNPNFTGRSHLLTSLRHSLTTGGHTALTQAVHGLGGVGKTQLALEYAYRHAPDYTLIYWVRSEEPAQLASDYASLAGPLNLPEKDAQDQTITIAAVRQWLERNDGWLLIFDNAQHPDAVRDYLPHTADVAAERAPVGATFLSRPSRHIIITSRDPNWGRVASPLEVPTWPRDESVAFLEKRSGHGGEDAHALAYELGDLPLALEQAAAYMEAAGMTLPDCLGLFRTRREELWKDEQPPLDYGKTVAATLTIAMERVDEDAPAATDLLNVCAFVAPDDIPLGLLRDHADELPEPLKSTVTDTLALNNAVASLRRYSLIQKDEDALYLHRLVQVVTRDRLSEEERKKWAASVVVLVNSAFPYKEDEPATWEESGRLLPHALAAAEHAASAEVRADETGALFNKTGMYLNVRARYVDAKAVGERALAMTERAFGSRDPRVGLCSISLGEALTHMDDLAGAKQHFERALTIFEQAYGADDPSVAVAANDLGDVLARMNDLRGAREQLERALHIDERARRADHPRVAIRVNNLGIVLYKMRDLKGAQAHFERALAIDEKEYGPEHPSVGITLTNLGSVRQDLGEVTGAREHFERAFAIFLKFLGEEHPHAQLVRRKLDALDQRKKS